MTIWRNYITEAGDRLKNYAESILVHFDEARDVLRDIDTVSRIRGGTNVTYGISKLPALLAGFQKKHPGIPIYTIVQNSSWLLPARMIWNVSGSHL